MTKIREYLSEDQLEEALKELKSFPIEKTDLIDKITIISGQYKNLLNKIDLGLISFEDEIVALNKIRIKILNTSKEVNSLIIDNNTVEFKSNLELYSELKGQSDILFRIDWTNNGKYLASPSRDNTVAIWDVTNQKITELLKFDNEVNIVKWFPNGIDLAIGLDGGKSYIWNNVNKTNYEINLGKKHIDAFAISPDGKHLALGGTSKKVLIFDRLSKEINDDLYEHTDWIWALDWTNDGTYLASGSRDRNICIWNTNNWNLVNKLEGHSDNITCLSWFPNSNRILVSTSNDGTFRVWDTIKGICLRVQKDHTDKVNCATFSFDGKILATKSNDSTVKFYDFQTGEVIYEIKEISSKFVFPSIKFHPKEYILASFGQEDTSIRLWHLIGFADYLQEVNLDKLSLYSESRKKKEVFDCFISHASEDKNKFVRPLAKELMKLGLKIWYDEFQLQIGDSLRKSIDSGLRDSKYGIVILSKSFFSKNWTNYELDGLTTKEMEGTKTILPVWYNITREDITKYSPTLADKIALDSSQLEIKEIALKIKKVLDK